MSKIPTEILCLILARGGSKGIPRKNIRLLAGKPLIAYSIECAKQSELIRRVIVSTEDEEIARIAEQYGAEVPFRRPKELAEDLTPDLPVFEHALRWLEEKEGYRPDLVVDLRPTGPLRKASTVDQAIRLLMEHPEADSLRSVIWPSQTPYKMWRVNPEGYLEKLLTLEGLTEPYNMPRQILPEIFWQNGYIDIVRPKIILEENLMSGKKILPFIIKEDYIEIDYEESFLKAEKIVQRHPA
ncbi:MAG: acylneuraminate cytidylyltransferase family protein [Candidatus Omnitrophica bacterium]|nr:acylneuraminate cytidylyltransferase family protein [Candidatus Omnitrophota bacterium]